MSAIKERLIEYIDAIPDAKLVTLEPLLKRLSEEKPGEDPQREYPYVCEYGYLHNPNAETIAAMEETEQIIRDPNRKRYSSFKELLNEIDAEIEAEQDDV